MTLNNPTHRSAIVGASVDVGQDTAREAEQVIAAFLIALSELTDEAPANSYRAVATRSGLQIEVFDDAPGVRTYGTPAPVEEVVAFLGEAEAARSRIALPADGEAFTAEELDTLRGGYRIYDHAGDRWEKRTQGDWAYVRPASDSPSDSLVYSSSVLADTWGPLTREAP